MEDSDALSPLGNAEMEANVMENFMKSFEEVQAIFNQNTVLISEISRNHEENAAQGGLTRNINLIRELNSNMGHVVQLYANISAEFVKSTKEDNGISENGGNAAATADNQASLAEPVSGSNKE